jgi:omega-hydroxy-beta-dihydromenaquinone-9 sulfotransferase
MGKAKKELKEHQLFITPLHVWIRLLLENRIPRSKWAMAAKITFFVMVTTPVRWLQWIWIRPQLHKVNLNEKPPVFVIGHWRSGTTHLHYLLAKDKRFVYLDSFQAFFYQVAFLSKWLMKPILQRNIPETRPQDNVKLDADSPQEEEHPLTNATHRAGMHSFFFPRNRGYIQRFNLFHGIDPKEREKWKKDYVGLLKQISLFQGVDGQLLLKNPHNTARIDALLECFPYARFVFIHRHPEEVYRSTMTLYRKAVRTQFLQEFSDAEIHERVMWAYEQTMRRYLELRHLIPPGQLIEIAYSDLDSQPIETLQRIYKEIELGNFSDVQPEIEAYLAQVADFEKNPAVPLSQELQDEIRMRWGFAFEEWKY